MTQAHMDREPGIDFARGLCAVAVMYYHYRPSEFFSFGLYGVLLFFMISGYCMTPSLQSSDSFGVFLKKRVIRLWPALLACAFISTVIERSLPLRLDRIHKWSDFTSSVLCIPLAETPCKIAGLFNANFYPFGYVDGAYWSLSVEMQFYIFIAIVFFLFGSKKFVPIISLLTPVFAVDVALQKFSVPSLFAYLPFFLTGIALFEYRKGSRQLAALALTSALVSLAIFRWKEINPVSMPISKNHSLVAFAISVVLLFWFSSRQTNHLFRFRNSWLDLPLKFFLILGMISYPLYLIHQDVGYVLIEFLKPLSGPLVTGVLVPLVSISIAWAVYKGFEIRFQKVLKRYLMPSRRPIEEPSGPVTVPARDSKPYDVALGG